MVSINRTYFLNPPFSYQRKPCKYFGSEAHQILDLLSLAPWESILASLAKVFWPQSDACQLYCADSHLSKPPLFNPYMKRLPEHWKINVIKTLLPSMSHVEPALESVFLHVNSQSSTPSVRLIQRPPTLYSSGMLVNNADSWAPSKTHK